MKKNIIPTTKRSIENLSPAEQDVIVTFINLVCFGSLEYDNYDVLAKAIAHELSMNLEKIKVIFKKLLAEGWIIEQEAAA